jgi:hypothetical protein
MQIRYEFRREIPYLECRSLKIRITHYILELTSLNPRLWKIRIGRKLWCSSPPSYEYATKSFWNILYRLLRSNQWKLKQKARLQNKERSRDTQSKGRKEIGLDEVMRPVLCFVRLQKYFFSPSTRSLKCITRSRESAETLTCRFTELT